MARNSIEAKASKYYVQRGDSPVRKIVARYRPLDVTYMQSPRNLGLLWVDENAAVYIVIRSHAWLIGVLPPTVYKFNRNAVVRWAKAKLEEWHRDQQASGWPGSDHGRVFRAWKER